MCNVHGTCRYIGLREWRYENRSPSSICILLVRMARDTITSILEPRGAPVGELLSWVTENLHQFVNRE